MPLYDFENTATGEVREFVAPVGTDHMRRRDGAWKRKAVSRLGIVVGARPDQSQKNEVIAGYAAAENRLGTRLRTRRSAREIKGIWATP